MSIVLDRQITGVVEEAFRREWIETNGVGGWASSTVAGAHTRRYHGLLVAATRPPVGRVVLLSKLDETVEIGGRRFELGCNQFPSATHPEGYRYLASFSRDLFPVFEYEVMGTRLRKTVAAVHEENTVVIMYEVVEADEDFVLELRPFVAGRDYHSLGRENRRMRREGTFRNGVFEVQPYDKSPTLYLSVPGSQFEPGPEWYLHFEYGVERYRGMDPNEDLFTHGVFRVPLHRGSRLGVIASTKEPSRWDAGRIFEAERERREALCTGVGAKNAFCRALVLAGDQFIVRRDRDLRTIIAGYHWFSDWGRDTMIALPGLCLVTGRFDDAKKILRAFAQSVSQGMLPNRFPDKGEEPVYNTVDATLWFFVAIYKYMQATGDEEFVCSELIPVLHNIIDWHDKGTRYGIQVDEDGLLKAGAPGTQLTWMDAKVFDWVVTPREGKAVEVNALWYNALVIFSELLKVAGKETEARELTQRARVVLKRFVQVFWNAGDGCLYDYVDGDTSNGAIRPNQIFALSLPFPLLSGRKARQVLKVVEDQLLTPFGLRSLAPGSRDYRPRYGGDQLSRDGAYHQGTVWSWLMGPYITALVRVRGPGARKTARELIAGFEPHLEKAGVGTISEIFDAEPPHAPRGCIAQAWGVAEILRAYTEDALEDEEDK